MFQIRSLTLLLISFALFSCNFKPVYKSYEDGQCNNFSVKSENYEEVAVKIKYPLQDKLNRACINKENNYKVNLILNKRKEPISIQRDREVARYNVLLYIKYKVTGAEKEFSGDYKIIGGFDSVVSDYGTYAQEYDTMDKIAKEASYDLFLKILSKLERTEE